MRVQFMHHALRPALHMIGLSASPPWTLFDESQMVLALVGSLRII
jgi:hypothetical protein